MVGQDGDGISLARLSVHGSRDASEKETGTRRSGDQSIGQDCQDTRHRLQSFQDVGGQVGCGQENGQGHRQPPGTKHPHRIHRQEHHESQETFEIVKAFLIFTNKARK